MAATKLLALLLQGLILFSVKVHEKPDEAAWKRMEEREKEMKQEMTHLMEEMERRSRPQWSLVPMIQQQRPQGQIITAWEAVLFAAIAGVLLLLFCLCWWLRKRCPEADSARTKEDVLAISMDEENEEGRALEGLEEEKLSDMIFDRSIKWPVQKIISRRLVVKGLVDKLLHNLRMHLSNSFWPELQNAIGVGSGFEGWSPDEADRVIYHLLLPLKPPIGHRFHLEPLGSRQQIPGRDCRIRVELECTCGGLKALCFLHRPENQMPKVLDILCTNSYLDVAKLARWFKGLVKKAWVTLLESRHYEMKVLPDSQTSCLMQLKSHSGDTFMLDILFGVQQGASDIFFSSPPRADSNTPSTIWAESYLVAERKFFIQIAEEVPYGSYHLKCLHLCTTIMKGTVFTPDMIKTVFMHVLNTTPVSGWRGGDCLMRMADVMRYLHYALEEKQLDSFFFGNANVPEEIILPPDFRRSKPPNLFAHLVQDQAAYTEALRQFEEIEEELLERVIPGILKEEACMELCLRSCMSAPGD
ncbi:inositol 1,4,5-trisphosphate receptor-interacting protein-like 1 [Dryobates pubescens]|uniref:inositol 1,4,5-trisphosphate receptor-interacting protein-like 1 n=1 Tax=Dryobates pubescens TaxID=118200 RepID=UPI0023B8DFE2|nr:inositol 1,4,5-trisphosphate receptor-interacting protein-like 1 [Dryobates pubescens]